MDFARQQRDPKRHLVGFTFVILIHALVVYALLTGLARKAVEVIKKPVTATIIEEIKKPPPPPPPPPPPKKVVEAPPIIKPPPQPYVPPPDIPPPVPQEAPVITSVAPTPPTEPYVIAPPAPPVVIAAPPAPPAPPPPPPKPAVRRGITPIKREEPIYPRGAIRAGIEKGVVVAQLAIDEGGNVTDVKIVSANPPRHFDSAVKDALINWKFAPDGTKYTGIIEVNFTLKE